jgi:hypothetical protein
MSSLRHISDSLMLSLSGRRQCPGSIENCRVASGLSIELRQL